MLVTDRMRPLQVQGRQLHQIGLPYHWGRNGISTGDAANELLVHQSLDPNVHIQEVKALDRATSGPGAGRAGRPCSSWWRSTGAGPGITERDRDGGRDGSDDPGTRPEDR